MPKTDQAVMPQPVHVAALGDVPHGFFGREGGVSAGEASGLQAGLGADDDPAAVAENRRRIVGAVLPGAALATVYQVHSDRVVRYLTAPDVADRPEADAMVTDRPSLLLGIVTADCAPVLLADPQAGVVGAAHAGWKGAVSGICERTVEAMEKLGASASRIVAAVGPCIAQRSYEVDRGFFDRFLAADEGNRRFFREGRDDHHHQFDLEGYVASRLAAAGLTTVELTGMDTYCDPDRFYSFRRATHERKANYGRQMAVIGLRSDAEA